MDTRCRQCHEIVEPSARSCPACGIDLRVMVPELVDLTETIDLDQDDDRERAELLGALLATGDADTAERHHAPAWGAHTPTMLDLEHAPVRIGRFPSADDVLPAASAPTKRSWRRR